MCEPAIDFTQNGRRDAWDQAYEESADSGFRGASGEQRKIRRGFPDATRLVERVQTVSAGVSISTVTSAPWDSVLCAGQLCATRSSIAA